MLTLSSSGLIRLLLELVIACLVLYGVYVFIGFLNLPQPIRNLVLIVIAVIGLVFLLNLFGLGF